MGLWREPRRETRSTSFISRGILQHISEFPCHASRASWAYHIKTLSVNSSRSFTFGTDDRLYQMSHSAKMIDCTRCLTQIFYEHALAAILAVSVIHAMKREQSRILAVSAILAVSVARVIWRDSLAKFADTKIIGIDTQ
jgi:hypothetical protein